MSSHCSPSSDRTMWCAEYRICERRRVQAAVYKHVSLSSGTRQSGSRSWQTTTLWCRARMTRHDDEIIERTRDTDIRFDRDTQLHHMVYHTTIVHLRSGSRVARAVPVAPVEEGTPRVASYDRMAKDRRRHPDQQDLRGGRHILVLQPASCASVRYTYLNPGA